MILSPWPCTMQSDRETDKHSISVVSSMPVAAQGRDIYPSLGTGPLRKKSILCIQFSSVQFSHSVVSDSLWPHESQHARPSCPSSTPGVHSDSRPSSHWCHPLVMWLRSHSSFLVDVNCYNRYLRWHWFLSTTSLPHYNVYISQAKFWCIFKYVFNKQ